MLNKYWLVGLVPKLCPTLWDPMDCSPQVPLSMGFSRQEYWSGLSFPSPGDFPDPGIEPGSPVLQVDSFLIGATSEAWFRIYSPVFKDEVILSITVTFQHRKQHFCPWGMAQKPSTYKCHVHFSKRPYDSLSSLITPRLRLYNKTKQKFLFTRNPAILQPL